MFVQHQRSIESLAVFALETFNQPCLALCNQFNNLLVGKMFVALVTEDGKCAVHVGTFRHFRVEQDAPAAALGTRTGFFARNGQMYRK